MRLSARSSVADQRRIGVDCGRKRWSGLDGGKVMQEA